MSVAYHIITNEDLSTLLNHDNPTTRNLYRRRGSRHGPNAGGSGTGRDEPYNNRIGRGIDNANQTDNTAEHASNNSTQEENYESNERQQSPDIFQSPSDTIFDSQIEEILRGEYSDELDCSLGKAPKRAVNRSTPWKVIAHHTGTRRNHYHIIYISTAKNWGFNSRLGKLIHTGEYKCSSVACVMCLYEYITTGCNRAILFDNLSTQDKEVAKCVAHQMGLQHVTRQEHNDGNSERRIVVFPVQGAARTDVEPGVDNELTQPDEGVHPAEEVEFGNQRETGVHEIGVEQAAVSTRNRRATDRTTTLTQENQKLVLHLCEHAAFSEGEAQKLLCRTPEGIAIQFRRHFEDRLKTAISISKTLVFQETGIQRTERCKKLQKLKYPNADDNVEIMHQLAELENILLLNYIDLSEFAKDTYEHFNKLTKKKNNLFFYGPPSTGKTMIMESLVEMHFNYTRLTGLHSTSTFNFSSLIHVNACFMDECKITDNQFEQWKLLAARQPMSTDVKYKSRHNVTDCVLYTANYPIGTYVTVPEANAAIDTRTIQYNFMHPTTYIKITAFTWEKFWDKHYLRPLRQQEDIQCQRASPENTLEYEYLNQVNEHLLLTLPSDSRSRVRIPPGAKI